MNYSDETIALAALSDIFCYHPRTGAALYERVGGAAAIFSLGHEGLRELLGPGSPLTDSIGNAALDKAVDDLRKADSAGARFLGVDSPDYPQLLRECPDYPLGLYVCSESPDSEIFSPAKSVAFVGTRDLSPYGRKWCEKLVGALGNCHTRICVVSGLALGIDGIAHKTALDAGLPTIAVMATGIESIYPYQHIQLAKSIASSPGSALVTTYPPGTSPLATQFLSRNRIIAGLSEATVLVESKVKGGGMITARHAADYGRDVFALPGRVEDIRSGGCNLLIRDQIASALTDADDLVRQLGLRDRILRRGKGFEEYLHARLSASVPSEEIPGLISLARTVRNESGISVSELAALTGRDTASVISDIMLLQGEGILSVDILQRCSIVTKNM